MKFVTSLLLITLGLMTDGYTVGFDDDDIQEVTYNDLVEHHRLKRSTEAPSEQRTLITQEGFRENANKFKDKVKQKVNGTVSGAKDKIKQKIKDKIKQKAKDKVKKKIEEKLDPTGGYMKFPVIFGVVVTIIISFFVLCIVCCCCCPFCLLHKRRTRGVVFRPAPPTVQTQVVTVVPTQPGYTPIQNNTHLQQPYPPQGYAAPPQGYMPQPQLQPQPQPQPQLQPQPGYVPLAANPPYPTSTCLNPAQSGNPSSENPPPYTEKQLPFNPNY